MRVLRTAALLAVAIAGVTSAAGAAPSVRQSVSPLVGVWSSADYGAVLRIGWEPRGLHGAKTAEFYADVIKDFRFWSDGCLHRTGERLFEVNPVGSWPQSFEGTGVVLKGDTYTSSDCATRTGTKITVSFSAYSSSNRYGLNVGFYRSDGGATGSSALYRTAVPGEKVANAEGGDYVAPGIYRGTTTPAVSFNVDAGGTFTDPSGRFLASTSVSATLTCATWSAAKQRWTPMGRKQATLTWGPHVTITGTSATVKASISQLAGKTTNRLELNGSFRDWTHLTGTVRAVTYLPAGAMPANPDKPGKSGMFRCDSGAVPFTSEHVPGSWQTIAGNRK